MPDCETLASQFGRKHATKDKSLWVFQVSHWPRENLSSKIMCDVYKYGQGADVRGGG